MSRCVEPLRTIEALFARAGGLAEGEAVTPIEHALQCASVAEAWGAPPALVTAALLHDIGHLLQAGGQGMLDLGVDDRHEAIGASWLGQWFGAAVTRPVALHVEAKRCLCCTDPLYRGELSARSRAALPLQGGPMNEREVAVFATRPYAVDAMRVRRWDEMGKVAGATTGSLEHFLAIASRCVRA